MARLARWPRNASGVRAWVVASPARVPACLPPSGAHHKPLPPSPRSCRRRCGYRLLTRPPPLRTAASGRLHLTACPLQLRRKGEQCMRDDAHTVAHASSVSLGRAQEVWGPSRRPRVALHLTCPPSQRWPRGRLAAPSGGAGTSSGRGLNTRAPTPSSAPSRSTTPRPTRCPRGKLRVRAALSRRQALVRGLSGFLVSRVHSK